jgi:hypothetical protein
MKLRDFEQHPNDTAAVRRQGAGHTIYTNPTNGKSAAVPRHSEIKTATLRRICQVLDIPAPLTR